MAAHVVNYVVNCAVNCAANPMDWQSGFST